MEFIFMLLVAGLLWTICGGTAFIWEEYLNSRPRGYRLFLFGPGVWFFTLTTFIKKIKVKSK
jgi:hypothetical protein